MRKILKKEIKPNGKFQKKEQTEKSIPAQEENPVYLKLGYYETLEAKRDLLSSEMSFLNVLKIMKRYNALRAEEIKLKLEMYRTIRELDLSLRKTKSSFPFLKIPEKARRQEIVKRETIREAKPAREEIVDEDLESQLRSIQERLKSIGR
jgi:hypothetical protein